MGRERDKYRPPRVEIRGSDFAAVELAFRQSISWHIHNAPISDSATQEMMEAHNKRLEKIIKRIRRAMNPRDYKAEYERTKELAG